MQEDLWCFPNRNRLVLQMCGGAVFFLGCFCLASNTIGLLSGTAGFSIPEIDGAFPADWCPQKPTLAQTTAVSAGFSEVPLTEMTCPTPGRTLTQGPGQALLVSARELTKEGSITFLVPHKWGLLQVYFPRNDPSDGLPGAVPSFMHPSGFTKIDRSR